MSEAISEATATSDSLSFDHVAMVCFDNNGKSFVIEACAKEGVRRISLEKFLAERLGVADNNKGEKAFGRRKRELFRWERRRSCGEEN